MSLSDAGRRQLHSIQQATPGRKPLVFMGTSAELVHALEPAAAAPPARSGRARAAAASSAPKPGEPKAPELRAGVMTKCLFQGKQVRYVTFGGRVYWVASDVTDTLGLPGLSKIVAGLQEKEREKEGELKKEREAQALSELSLWVGNIPIQYAEQGKLRSVLKDSGVLNGLTRMTVRAKPGKRNGSWALLNFASSDALSAAAAATVTVDGDGGERVALEIKRSEADTELERKRSSVAESGSQEFGALEEMVNDHKGKETQQVTIADSKAAAFDEIATFTTKGIFRLVLRNPTEISHAFQVILPPASEVSNEGPRSRVLGLLPAVSWAWFSAWGSLEPPRRDGENAQKTGIFGGKMGEIWTKKCEPRELTKDQTGRTLWTNELQWWSTGSRRKRARRTPRCRPISAVCRTVRPIPIRPCPTPPR